MDNHFAVSNLSQTLHDYTRAWDPLELFKNFFHFFKKIDMLIFKIKNRRLQTQIKLQTKICYNLKCFNGF